MFFKMFFYCLKVFLHFSFWRAGGCGRHGNAMEQYTWALSAYCCMSWWRAHWRSCIRRVNAACLRGGRAVLPGYREWGGFVSFMIWTHLLLYSCVVHVRVGILLKVELCKVSSQRKRCVLARHLSVVHTVQVWLPRLTEHFRCLYRPGLKDANKPRYRLLRRKLWSVRFFPLAVFPTISQTLAAEALAISMEVRWAT